MSKRDESHGWKHDDLLADLAGFLRGPDRMVWTDMQLGPSGSPRPDVFTLQKSYSKPLPSAFEIKISRSDLRSDTTSGKWQSYLRYAGSVTFAVPDGLCTVADIPESCGLIVRKDAIWRYARKATRQPVDIPKDAWMKLLLDGRGREFHPAEPRSRRIDLWHDNERIRQKFGGAVAKAARDLAAVEKRVGDLRTYAEAAENRAVKDADSRKAYILEQAAKQVAGFEEAKNDLMAWLGIEGSASVHTVRHAIAKLRGECDADARVRAAEQAVSSARHALQSAINALPEKKAATAPWTEAA